MNANITYYYKLIKRNKLINFWSFSGKDLKQACSLNYKFIFCFYKKNILFNFNTFISIVKKICPLFYSIVDNNGTILFIGTKNIYLQNISKNNFFLLTNLVDWNTGIFTNFSKQGFKFFNKLEILKNPSIIIFFNATRSNFLILEARKKEIPMVGLIDSNINHFLIDYPIFINSFYFYNIYILTRFFFRYIKKLI